MIAVTLATSVLLVACGGLVQDAAAQASQTPPTLPSERRLYPVDELETVKLTIREHEFEVWVADDHFKRQEGMMFLSEHEVRSDQGMIFVFTEPQPLRFWMRNTLIPLDIAYLDADRVILNTHTMRPLDELTDYSSRGDAKYALEVKSGTFRRLGIGPGDKVVFPETVVARDNEMR